MRQIKEIKSANSNDYISVIEASKILGMKEGVIRNYLNLGKIITYKFKGLTLLSRLEIEILRDK